VPLASRAAWRTSSSNYSTCPNLYRNRRVSLGCSSLSRPLIPTHHADLRYHLHHCPQHCDLCSRSSNQPCFPRRPRHWMLLVRPQVMHVLPQRRVRVAKPLRPNSELLNAEFRTGEAQLLGNPVGTRTRPSLNPDASRWPIFVIIEIYYGYLYRLYT
jgi:hypothetical protein